jgi:hypothetical protein
MSKPRGFICDIDGTVADKGDRGIHDYDKVGLDNPKEATITVVKILAAEMQPLFMSGRPDTNQCRKDTQNWIIRNIDPFGQFFDIRYHLLMRPEFLKDKPSKRDFRKDYEVKKELYETHVEPFYDIQFAIDDRPQVLKLWHELDIFTFAVGTPLIDF